MDAHYAIYLGDQGYVTIYESGTAVYNAGAGFYVAGAVFRVAIESGVVKYKKNGTTFYTSTIVPTYPLIADTSFWSNGANLSSAVISGTLSGGSGGALNGGIHWLVTDQLGTPRMIFDQSGNRASVKRHDYLPFGEELYTGVGGRTTAQGYIADTVRQKFTLKERDNETGLDYFLARYYSP